MDTQKAYRKTALNTFVAFLGIAIASHAQLIPDGALAFVVSTISIHVACFAAMMACVWPCYLAYVDGDLEGDYTPVTPGDAKTAALEYVQARRKS